MLLMLSWKRCPPSRPNCVFNDYSERILTRAALKRPVLVFAPFTKLLGALLLVQPPCGQLWRKSVYSEGCSNGSNVLLRHCRGGLLHRPGAMHAQTVVHTIIMQESTTQKVLNS